MAADNSMSSTPDCYTAHDIFLSHSGVQKGFVKDLYDQLSICYNTFFDITHHSLPPGESFPPRIFQAAETCSLALVVLSEEFVVSKWPMMELSIFVDNMAKSADFKLIPLFFKLSPQDLKEEENLSRWRKSWEVLAGKQDPQHPLNTTKWPQALQALSAISGEVFKESLEGESTFIRKVMSAVSAAISPAFTFDKAEIVGKDRLCEVILAKFKKMEQHLLASTASQPMISVLGLYGSPGSGKSTLCKCLLDHFRPSYGSNRTLYIEFRLDQSDADVVEKLKELVDLTDFRNRVKVDKAANVEHVLDLLRKCRLSSCKVFLVVDNIFERSCDAILRTLHRVGVGEGSKIILVARSLDVLQPILDLLKLDPIRHWACESIATPTINEIEATQILLNSARPALESSSLEQRNIARNIVRMSNIGNSYNGWLPLVMNAMGARLVKYEGPESWKLWEKDSGMFWTSMKTYKEDIIIKDLLGENFETLLDEHSKILFLDVVLFFLHFENNYEKVCNFLSMMHGFPTTKIRMMMKDLMRCSFLTVTHDGFIYVHDLYMEFAKAIKDCPSKHLKKTSVRWIWKHHQVSGKEAGSVLLLENQNVRGEESDLRALTLEVGEGCERVNLKGFSALKAVACINCKSLVVLRLRGLRSLKILEIRNCANFCQLVCKDASLLNVKQLDITKRKFFFLEEEHEEHEPPNFPGQEQTLMKPFKKPRSLELGLLASNMRNLQVLRLKNTGIPSLELAGSNLSQLRELLVIEQHLKKVDLGNLPNLTDAMLCHSDTLEDPSRYVEKWTPTEMECFEDGCDIDWDHLLPELSDTDFLTDTDFLAGCPKLKRVTIQSPFFKQDQRPAAAGLVSFQLQCLYNLIELPDLSLSTNTLEKLSVVWCEKLERVNFDIGFKRLCLLILEHCDNLMEVTGMGSLPSLHTLDVCRCKRLQKLSGLGKCSMLVELKLKDCPELIEVSCFSSLLNLVRLEVSDCPNLRTSIANRSQRLVRDMEKLRYCGIEFGGGPCCLNLRNCKSIEGLRVTQFQDCSSNGTDFFEGTLMLEDLDNLQNLERLAIFGENTSQLEDLDNLQNLEELTIFEESTSQLGLSSVLRGRGLFTVLQLPGRGACLPGLTHLYVAGLDALHSVDGIEHLVTLESVGFFELNNLTSLNGVDRLINLEELRVVECPLLEEMPSLHALVRVRGLEVEGCPRLRAVEGCDHMPILREVSFDGCKSMECFPFNDPMSLSSADRISFEGCKFVCSFRIAAWAEDESEDRVPPCLRCACFNALLWEHYVANGSAHKEQEAKGLIEGPPICMLHELLHKVDTYAPDHGDFPHFYEDWMIRHEHMKGEKAEASAQEPDR